MRRRARLPPRPALPRRAVVAFPEGLPDAVEAFRRDHDPLAAALGAHLTLVFPFASSLSGMQVAAHVRRVAGGWPVLPLALAGVDAYDARWVHLRVTRGAPALAELHDRLYRGALAPFLRREFDYAPHLTVGRAADAAACDAVLAAARTCFARPLEAVVRALCVVTLAADGPARVEREIGLGA